MFDIRNIKGFQKVVFKDGEASFHFSNGFVIQHERREQQYTHDVDNGYLVNGVFLDSLEKLKEAFKNGYV